jgi:hypothetical protein
MPDIKGLKIELTQTSENLPLPTGRQARPSLPSGPEALWAGGQRGVIPPFGKGRWGGILQINVVIIVRLLINDDRYPTLSNP